VVSQPQASHLMRRGNQLRPNLQHVDRQSTSQSLLVLQAAHLRLVVSQPQANFLVRRDNGVVRLQAIRDHMKAQGLPCEIKLHDDKGCCVCPPPPPPIAPETLGWGPTAILKGPRL